MSQAAMQHTDFRNISKYYITLISISLPPFLKTFKPMPKKQTSISLHPHNAKSLKSLKFVIYLIHKHGKIFWIFSLVVLLSN